MNSLVARQTIELTKGYGNKWKKRKFFFNRFNLGSLWSSGTFVTCFAFVWPFAGVTTHMFVESRLILVSISAYGTQMCVNTVAGVVGLHVFPVKP